MRRLTKVLLRRGLAAVLLAVIVGGTGFGIGYILLNDDGEATAQRGDTAEERIATIEAEFGLPQFVGTMNGIRFIADGVPGLAESFSPKCRENAAGGSNIRDAEPSELAGSDLDFSPGYLPSGSTPNAVVVNACEDDIIAVSKDYVVAPEAGQLLIRRRSGPPIVGAFAPAERMEAITVRGRYDGVAVEPAFPGDRAAVIFSDGRSVWSVHGVGVPFGELVEVAEGVAD